jgi:protein-disulfide isomerase
MRQQQNYLILFIISLISLFSHAAQADSIDKLFHQANDPIGGNSRGRITIVEFFDYQCGYCLKMAPIIANIIKNNPNVRIVFKDFPIRGPLSETAARVALAANKQGRYYVFSHSLLTATSPLTVNRLFVIAKQHHLNVHKLRKDMASTAISNQLAANNALAEELNVTGTPTFYIGRTNAKSMRDTYQLFGEVDQSALQSIIDRIHASEKQSHKIPPKA